MNWVTTAWLAPRNLVEISLQCKYFLYMYPVIMVDILYFSLSTNDFDIPDIEEVMQPWVLG